VAIKKLQKLFPAQVPTAQQPAEPSGALKSSRKKHKKLKKEKERQKQVEASAPQPYQELDSLNYHPIGVSRVYAFRHESVSSFLHHLLC
jgi:hypothetical protein